MILPVAMWYSLKMYYVLTLFNLNCKFLKHSVPTTVFSTLPHLLFLFIYPGCTHTSFSYLYNTAHENGLHQKKKKKKVSPGEVGIYRRVGKNRIRNCKRNWIRRNVIIIDLYICEMGIRVRGLECKAIVYTPTAYTSLQTCVHIASPDFRREQIYTRMYLFYFLFCCVARTLRKTGLELMRHFLFK